MASLLPPPPAGEVPPNPRVFQLTFFTDQGDVIATSQVQVGAGESKFLEISFEDAVTKIPPGPPTGPPPLPPIRVDIFVVAQGILTIGNPSALGGPEHPPQPCLPSLEIYDLDTGKTTISQEVLIAFHEGDPDRLIILSNGALGSADRGRLPGFFPGLVGVAPGQHARLSVVSLLPKPLPGQVSGATRSFTLTFFTDQGTVIATSTVQVGPGEPKFLDISFDDVLKFIPPGPPFIPPGPSQNRLEIRGVAVGIMDPMNPRHPPEPCIPSLQIYDVATGKTTVALLPAVQ
jgi:hypothetical protein